jgi:hypothetical protein
MDQLGAPAALFDGIIYTSILIFPLCFRISPPPFVYFISFRYDAHPIFLFPASSDVLACNGSRVFFISHSSCCRSCPSSSVYLPSHPSPTDSISTSSTSQLQQLRGWSGGVVAVSFASRLPCSGSRHFRGAPRSITFIDLLPQERKTGTKTEKVAISLSSSHCLSIAWIPRGSDADYECRNPLHVACRSTSIVTLCLIHSDSVMSIRPIIADKFAHAIYLRTGHFHLVQILKRSFQPPDNDNVAFTFDERHVRNVVA